MNLHTRSCFLEASGTGWNAQSLVGLAGLCNWANIFIFTLSPSISLYGDAPIAPKFFPSLTNGVAVVRCTHHVSLQETLQGSWQPPLSAPLGPLLPWAASSQWQGSGVLEEAHLYLKWGSWGSSKRQTSQRFHWGPAEPAWELCFWSERVLPILLPAPAPCTGLRPASCLWAFPAPGCPSFPLHSYFCPHARYMVNHILPSASPKTWVNTQCVFIPCVLTPPWCIFSPPLLAVFWESWERNLWVMFQTA